MIINARHKYDIICYFYIYIFISSNLIRAADGLLPVDRLYLAVPIAHVPFESLCLYVLDPFTDREESASLQFCEAFAYFDLALAGFQQ